MRPTKSILILFAGVVLLAGCAGNLDPDQARTCRIALVALVPDQGPVEITRQGAVPPVGGGPAGVRVEYRSSPPGGLPHSGFVECRFSSAATADQRVGLVGLRSDETTVSEPSLYFLKRFWLETAEGNRADPQPIAAWGRLPRLPATAAYTLQNLLNSLPSMASYGLLAAAYSLIYGLVGRINLAFGEMAAIGGAGSLTGLAFLREPETAVLVAVALLAGIWASTLHGVVIGRWVFTPLRRSTNQQGLVATVGLALVLNEYLRLAQGPAPLWIPPLRTSPIAVARSSSFVVTMTPIGGILVLVSAAITTLVLLLMSRSQFGRNWRAMADDAPAAALLGVSPARIFAQSFALASALAGASGATVVLVYGSFGASYGASLGLKALLAAVLGGIGSVRGALFGGVALGTIEALWSAFFPIEQRDLVVFSALAFALILRPGGFLGFRDLVPRRV